MKSPAKPRSEDERKKRLAQQLRANLARRKEQARERGVEPGSDVDSAVGGRPVPPPENDT